MKRSRDSLTWCRSFAAVAGLIMAGSVSAAADSITFAQFIQTSVSQQQWSISTSASTTTVSASGLVEFAFANYTGLPFNQTQTAQFTLSATSSTTGKCAHAGCGTGDSFLQPGYTGTFSFIDQASAPGANLLSGTFSISSTPATSGALLGASVDSSAASFLGSQTPGNLTGVVFSSDYIDFTNSTYQAASFSLSSLVPSFAVGPVSSGNEAFPAARTFSAAGTGTFSATAQTPEPATSMMIGAGLLGIGFLRRRVLNRSRWHPQSVGI